MLDILLELLSFYNTAHNKSYGSALLSDPDPDTQFRCEGRRNIFAHQMWMPYISSVFTLSFADHKGFKLH